MRYFLRAFCVLCVSFVWLVVFSGVSVSADTLPAGGRYMTASETRQMVGDTISVRYFNGSDYVDTTARYVNSNSSYGYPETLVGGSPAVVPGQSFIYYRFDAHDISDNMSYITCDLTFNYSFFDSEYFYTWIMFSHGFGGEPVSSVYQSPSVDGFFAGESFHVENTQVSNGFHDWLKVQIPDYFLQGAYVPLELSSPSVTSGYVTRAVFNGGSSSYYGAHYIVIACPYVSDSAYGSQGTFTETTATTSGSGDINVTVDMTETNSLLGTLISAVQAVGSFIIDGVKGLFVPSEEDMQEWVQDMRDMLRGHFGSFFDAMEMIDRVFSSVQNSEPLTSIGLQQDLSVNLAGETMVFRASEWSMPLVPDGFGFLVTIIKDFIDIICTLLVLNMCRTQFEIFLNPEGEVITD